MTENPLSDSNSSPILKTPSRKGVRSANTSLFLILSIYLLIGGFSKLETTPHSQDESISQQGMSDEEGSDSNFSRPPLSTISQETDPRTPMKATKIFAMDTPRAGRVQENPDFRSSFVKRQRKELLESLGWECFSDTVEYFFEHVLPPFVLTLKSIKSIRNAYDRGY